MAARTIIVTGSNKGIGRGIVEEVLKTCPEFTKVILTARNLELGNATVAEINATGDFASRLHLMQLDIANAESISNFASEFSANHGKVDVLVNNAGFAYKNDVKNTFQTGVDTFNINYFGTINFTEAMLPHMNNSGHIVVVGSRAGSLHRIPVEENRAKLLADSLTREVLEGYVQEFLNSYNDNTTEALGWRDSQYGSSKAFLQAWVRIISKSPELTEKAIRINALCPGWIATDMAGASAPGTITEGIATPMLLIKSSDDVTGRFWYNSACQDWNAVGTL